MDDDQAPVALTLPKRLRTTSKKVTTQVFTSTVQSHWVDRPACEQPSQPAPAESGIETLNYDRHSKSFSERAAASIRSSLVTLRSPLLFQWRQPIPVFPDQPRKLPRAPETRNENFRLGERAEKPAEIVFVGPVWDPHLVAGEKSERGADAMNRWPVIESLKKIPAELVLHSSSNRDHNVPRAVLPGDLQQRFVSDRPSVFWCNEDVFLRNRDT